MKFQIDDEVVIIAVGVSSSEEKHLYVGKSFIVDNIRTNYLGYYYSVKGIKYLFWSDEEIELLSVYKSPLYEALR